jgi:predicted glycoside hydrolase/deacetylase ChbG (UPF0249 family)
MPMVRRAPVVVTADDLGLTRGVTRGILDAHRHGIVRSTSLLVTYSASEEAAAMAREERELEIGLHLDLVGGAPASEPARVRSLIGADGRFRGLGGFLAALARGAVRGSELAAEVRAQVRRARGWGVPADAWDSHRHVHALPLVARVVGAVARQEQARWIRRVRPAPVWRGWKPWTLAASAAASERFYAGLPGNTWYVDLSSWRPADASRIARLAGHGGRGEIGAHPGYSDDELRTVDTLHDGRDRDLALLTDPLLRSTLAPGTVAWRAG